MFRNTASQKITFFAFIPSTGLPKTGDAANLTAYVSKDDGTVTVLADTSATETDATNAKGLYIFDVAQGETNADKLVFSCKSSTSDVSVVPVTVYTRPPNANLLSIDASGRVDVIKIAGTTQTARDLGTSVLLSSGTGTGQISLTSGRVNADMVAISGDTTAADNLEQALDDTAGSVPWTGIVDQGTAQSVSAATIVLRSAAAFGDDDLNGATVELTSGNALGARAVITDYVGSTDTATVSWPGTTPTGTPTYKIFASAPSPSVAQTGDAYARLGAPAGASVSADVAAVKTDTGNLVTRITSTLFSGITSLSQWLGLLAGKQSGNSTARTEVRATGAGSGTFDETTDSQEAIRDNQGTAQTGDTYARIGAPAGASVSADVAAVKVDTAAVKVVTDKVTTAFELDGSVYRLTTNALEQAPTGGGAADGSGFTSIPWNPAWDAEVQSEAADALNAYDPPTKAELDTAVSPLATASAVSSLASTLSTIAGYVDTEVAAIKAKTDNLPTDPADASDVAASFASVSASLVTLAGYIDTEVAAIKAKTDKLTFDGSNNVAANAKAINDTDLTGDGTTGTPWGPA
jgi:hypothetical protein